MTEPKGGSFPDRRRCGERGLAGGCATRAVGQRILALWNDIENGRWKTHQGNSGNIGATTHGWYSMVCGTYHYNTANQSCRICGVEGAVRQRYTRPTTKQITDVGRTRVASVDVFQSATSANHTSSADNRHVHNRIETNRRTTNRRFCKNGHAPMAGVSSNARPTAATAATTRGVGEDTITAASGQYECGRVLFQQTSRNNDVTKQPESTQLQRVPVGKARDSNSHHKKLQARREIEESVARLRKEIGCERAGAGLAETNAQV